VQEGFRNLLHQPIMRCSVGGAVLMIFSLTRMVHWWCLFNQLSWNLSRWSHTFSAIVKQWLFFIAAALAKHKFPF